MCFVQLLAPVQGFSQEVQAAASPSSPDGRPTRDGGEGKHGGSRAGEGHHASIQRLSLAWTERFPTKPPAWLPADASNEGAEAALSISSPSQRPPGAHTPGSGG